MARSEERVSLPYKGASTETSTQPCMHATHIEKINTGHKINIDRASRCVRQTGGEIIHNLKFHPFHVQESAEKGAGAGGRLISAPLSCLKQGAEGRRRREDLFSLRIHTYGQTVISTACLLMK